MADAQELGPSATIHHPLHTDCASYHHTLQILALTSYELGEAIPDDPKSPYRYGSVYFYTPTHVPSDHRIEEPSKVLLERIKVKDIQDKHVDHLQPPGGVFDIRWSSKTAFNDPRSGLDSGSMVLALFNGSIQHFDLQKENSQDSASLPSSSPSESYGYIRVRNTRIFEAEMEGDMALGVDLSSISLSDDDCDAPPPDTSSGADSSGRLHPKRREYAAVGYQQGGVAVWDLESGATTPIWSCPDAHMAEVWQTQFIGDESLAPTGELALDAAGDDESLGRFGMDSVAFGRRAGNLFVSGSDDASFKIWDLRSDPSEGPVMQNRKYYKVGVTSFASPLASPSRSAQSRMPFGLLVGSYDESLSMWDLRAMRNPVNSIGLGGGVWRIRWLPDDGIDAHAEAESNEGLSSSSSSKKVVSRLAVAAMHAGFKVVDLLEDSTVAASIHQAEASSISMKESSHYWGPHTGSADGKFPPLAYGIDWISAWRNPIDSASPSVRSHYLAGCTFYDNCLSIWNPAEHKCR